MQICVFPARPSTVTVIAPHRTAHRLLAAGLRQGKPLNALTERSREKMNPLNIETLALVALRSGA